MLLVFIQPNVCQPQLYVTVSYPYDDGSPPPEKMSYYRAREDEDLTTTFQILSDILKYFSLQTYTPLLYCQFTELESIHGKQSSSHCR